MRKVELLLIVWEILITLMFGTTYGFVFSIIVTLAVGIYRWRKDGGATALRWVIKELIKESVIHMGIHGLLEHLSL